MKSANRTGQVNFTLAIFKGVEELEGLEAEATFSLPISRNSINKFRCVIDANAGGNPKSNHAGKIWDGN